MQSSTNGSGVDSNSYKIIEFFSGIGGWASALSNFQNRLAVNIVAAFDINEIANEAYKYNFCRQPTSILIQSLTVNDLEKLEANVWVMSPPCQPFTRNNTTDIRDKNDTRSDGFLHLIQILKDMRHPPQYIAIENVVGFEKSECCTYFLTTLEDMGYKYLQFILCPKQLGIPNSRPRYYCIACLVNRTVTYDPSTIIINDTVTTTSSVNTNIMEKQHIIGLESYQSTGQGIDPPPQVDDWKSRFPSNRATILTQFPSVSEVNKPLQPLGNYLDISNDDDEQLLVPQKLLQKQASQCFDVVGLHSTSSTCFTKSYSRFVRGTGSIIFMEPLQFLSTTSTTTTLATTTTIPPLYADSISGNTSTIKGVVVVEGTKAEIVHDETLYCTQEKNMNETIEQQSEVEEGTVNDMTLQLTSQRDLIKKDREHYYDNVTSGGDENKQQGKKRNISIEKQQEQQQVLGKVNTMKESQQLHPFPAIVTSTTTTTTIEAKSSITINKENEEYHTIYNNASYNNHLSKQIPSNNSNSNNTGSSSHCDNNSNFSPPITGNNLAGGRYRYFSPEEMLRLLGFPLDDGSFRFPSHYSKKQCYQLIGNSVSVTVLIELLNYMFFHFRN